MATTAQRQRVRMSERIMEAQATAGYMLEYNSALLAELKALQADLARLDIAERNLPQPLRAA